MASAGTPLQMAWSRIYVAPRPTSHFFAAAATSLWPIRPSSAACSNSARGISEGVSVIFTLNFPDAIRCGAQPRL